MVLQIALSFLLYNKAGLQVLRHVGWIIWAVSGTTTGVIKMSVSNKPEKR
jgi:hypothetical protein